MTDCLFDYSVQPESIVSSPHQQLLLLMFLFFTTGMPSLKDLIQNDESVTRKMTVALYSTCPDMRSVVHGAEKKKTWQRSRVDSLSLSENEKGNSGKSMHWYGSCSCAPTTSRVGTDGCAVPSKLCQARRRQEFTMN